MKLLLVFLITLQASLAASLPPLTTIRHTVEKKVSLSDTTLPADFTTTPALAGHYPFRLDAKCMLSTCSVGLTTSATSVDARTVTSNTTISIGIVYNGTMDTRRYITTSKWNGDFEMTMFYGRLGDR